MDTATATFRRLHQLHRQIHDLCAKAAAGPRRAAKRQQSIDARREEVDALHAQRKRYRVEADQSQVKLDAGEERLAKEQVRLNVAKDNKEYSAIQLEMKHIREANAKLEDITLDRLARSDQALEAIRALQQAIAEEEAEVAKLVQQSEDQRGQTEQVLAERRAELTELEQGLAGPMVTPYRRLVDSMGPDALASVRDMVCEGCFTGITSQSHNELVIGRDMVLCTSCGRILYSADD